MPLFLLVLLLLAPAAWADTSGPRSLFTFSSEPPEGFASESEAGLALQAGNTKSNRVSLRHQDSYRWPEQTVFGQVRYLNANAAGVTNASSWLAGARYERKLAPKTGAFVGQTVEADRFAGYFQRYSSDLGLRRTLWKSDVTKGAAELGYRYQVDNRITGELTYNNLVRAYLEGIYYFNAKVSLVASVEGLPNVSDSANWMVNGDLGLIAELTSILSLKSTYGVRYDHVPNAPGLVTTDQAFTTALLARF